MGFCEKAISERLCSQTKGDLCKIVSQYISNKLKLSDLQSVFANKLKQTLSLSLSLSLPSAHAHTLLVGVDQLDG